MFNFSTLGGVVGLVLPMAIANAADTPAGLWQTFNPETGDPESVVRISESNGAYVGVVESILNPDEVGSICEQCKGDRKGKPVLGMTIIREFRPSKSEAGLWDGGYVLDVKNGKDYKANMRLKEGGKKLALRGFIGFSLIGRTDIFERIE
jgi:uncharacterized protein (DUF2147 family)